MPPKRATNAQLLTAADQCGGDVGRRGPGPEFDVEHRPPAETHSMGTAPGAGG